MFPALKIIRTRRTPARRPALLAATFALAAIGLMLTASSAVASYPGANGKIVFTRCEDGVACQTWKLWTMNGDGSGAARFLADPGYGADTPTITADGRRIAFQRCTPPAGAGFAPDCGIATVDAHGNGLKQLTPFKYVGDEYPTFSPDGSRIAFDRYVTGGYQIFVMNADGSNLHPITDGKANDDRPEFSPDGKKIVYHHGFQGSNSPQQLWLMNADGSNQHAITSDPSRQDYDPSFSPDGRQIVFQASTGGVYSIWSVNTDGTGAHKLTSPSIEDDIPVFSPDGKRILFTRSLADGTSRLYSMTATGGAPTQVGGGDDWYAAWSRVPTPSIDSPPKVAGVAQAGHALTATAGPGSWGGTASLQWLRCSASCAPIFGATAATYKPTNADIGATLKVRQTQTSAGGSVSALSAATAPVVAEPGARLVKLARTGKARLQARLACPATQSVVCNGRLTLTTRVRGHTVKVAARNYRIAAGADTRLTLRAKKTKALAGAHKLTARLVTRDDAGNTTTSKRSVALR